jgi:drug/metabolite transporter (DMT)-like permease
MNSMPGRAGNGGIALAFAAAATSGIAVFVNGYGVRAVPDATVYTTAKNLVAAAGLLVVAAVAFRAGRAPAVGPRHAPRPRQWLALAAVGAIGGSVPFVLFFEGLSRASSTHAAFIQKTLVVWVALLAVPLLGERLRAAHVAAVALLVGGLVALDGGLAGFAFGGGELMILTATLLWSLEIILVKRLLRGVAPTIVGLARMGLGVVLLLGWVTVSGRWSGLAGLDAVGWGWALLTGAVLAGYVVAWFTALSLAPAVDVTAILVVGAVITGLLDTLVRGAPLPAATLVGMALLAAGAAVAASGATRHSLPEPAA